MMLVIGDRKVERAPDVDGFPYPKLQPALRALAGAMGQEEDHMV